MDLPVTVNWVPPPKRNHSDIRPYKNLPSFHNSSLKIDPTLDNELGFIKVQNGSGANVVFRKNKNDEV